MTPAKPLRVLVVGAGMYVTGRGTDGTGTVLPALAQASKSLPIAGATICATSAAARDEVLAAAARVNRELGTSLPVDFRLAQDALSDPRADCAVVAVPDHLHHLVARALFSRDVPCLVVKPLTPTLAEAVDLVELQESRGLHGAVELHKRFDEANQLVRRWLREGRLGRLSYVTVEYSQRRDVPATHFRGWAARTNIFQYLAVHYVDLIHWMTAFLPERAMALGTRGILDDTYDSVHAVIEWRHPARAEEKLVSQIAASWIDPSRSTAMSDQRYTIVGERGRVDCDQKHRGVELVTAQGAQSVNPYFSERLLDGTDATQFSGYGYRSVACFLAEVAGAADRTGGRSATLRDALVSTAVIDAVNRSLAAGSSFQVVHAPT